MLRPGERLLGRLRFTWKFALVGIVLVLPLGLTAASYVTAQRGAIRFAQEERIGVAALDATRPLVLVAAEARLAALDGAPVDGLDAALARADAGDRRFGAELGTAAGWQATRAAIAAARALPPGPRAVDAWSDVLRALRAHVVAVGDASKLTLDPDLDTYYLMDANQHVLPQIVDALGASVTDRRAVASGRGGGARAAVRTQATLELLDDLDAAAAKIEANTQVPAVAQRSRASAAAVRQLATSALAADPTSQPAIEPLAAAWTTTSADLDRLLGRRIDGFERRERSVLALAVAAALIALYLFLAFGTSVIRPVRRIVDVLQEAGGGGTARVEVDGTDELATIATEVNAAVDRVEQARQLLERRALLDEMTGLPNRSGTLARIERGVEEGRAAGRPIAILLVDLDRFKQVNDTLGHAAGDDVIRLAALRLSSATVGAGTACRLAGDEFVVVTDPLDAVEDARALAYDALRAVARPYTIETPYGVREIETGASVGMVVIRPEDVIVADVLLARSSSALAESKRRGGGAVTVFEERLVESGERDVLLRRALRAAVHGGGIDVVYQPIVGAGDGRLHSIEALARWTGPDGPVPPDTFIAIAERQGLIVPLGRAVLGRALVDLGALRGASPSTGVAVNLSIRELDAPDLVPFVARALRDAGIPPQALCLEIDERDMVGAVEWAGGVLGQLRDLGVRIALDDFGAGATSLAYLAQFELDVLKLDRRFVNGLTTDPRKERIAEAVARLAHALGFEAVAEGVEEPAQLERVASLGYDHVQGFLLGRPGPLAALGRRAAPPAA